jgi:ABC-type tungstate transport system substrate-binding protein
MAGLVPAMHAFPRRKEHLDGRQEAGHEGANHLRHGMSGWVRYLVLTAKAKTGFSPQILILMVVGAAMGVAAFVLLNVTIFFLLSERFGPLWTSAGMTLGYLLLCVICIVAAIKSRRNAMENAQQALAARTTHAMFDTSALSLGLEIGRTIGWRRLVPIAAITLIAAGVAKEWGRRKAPKDPQD